MIDIAKERPLTFGQASKVLPRRRNDRNVHTSTLYRWKDGLRGVRLETIQVGGTLCTSLEALQRFFDRLTDGGREPPREVHRSAAREALTQQKLSDAGLIEGEQ